MQSKPATWLGMGDWDDRPLRRCFACKLLAAGVTQAIMRSYRQGMGQHQQSFQRQVQQATSAATIFTPGAISAVRQTPRACSRCTT